MHRREWLAWLYVLLWTLVIYVTIPFARTIQAVAKEHAGGRQVFMYAVLVAVGIAAAGGTAHVIIRYGRRSWSRLAWLAGVGAAYVFFTFRLRDSPEEALHFVEYGVLGALAFRALRHRVSDPTIYLAACLVGALIGTFDEVIQWITPRRYWDWRDIRLNASACLLMQVAIAGGVRPAMAAMLPPLTSLRLAWRWALALLVVLTLCLLNTPRRLERYGTRLPFLRTLSRNPSVMTEYGYRHVDAAATFFSRFTVAELGEEDRRRGREAAGVLDAYRDHGRYTDFLKAYPAVVDPFLHEARVHFFRRDHHIGMQDRYKDGEAAKARHCRIAYGEHLLIRRLYPTTLSHSRYDLSDDVLRFLERRGGAAGPYLSTVSKHLVTRFGEALPRAFLIVWIVAALIAEAAAARLSRYTHQRMP